MDTGSDGGIVDVSEFRKIKLAIGKVIEASDVEKSNKLLKLKVSIGDSTRTVISGIKKFYSADSVVGKRVIVITNLKHAKMMGIESEGMVLAASDDEGRLVLLTTDADIKEGSQVS